MILLKKRPTNCPINFLRLNKTQYKDSSDCVLLHWLHWLCKMCLFWYRYHWRLRRHGTKVWASGGMLQKGFTGEIILLIDISCLGTTGGIFKWSYKEEMRLEGSTPCYFLIYRTTLCVYFRIKLRQGKDLSSLNTLWEMWAPFQM